MIKISDEQKALLASYGRSVLGAGLAVYVSTGDLKLAANALWAASLPVIMRYLNSSDSSFGRKKEEEVDV